MTNPDKGVSQAGAHAPMLLVVSGRAGTGKTTLAKALCQRWKTCYLRVDAAEAALGPTGLRAGTEGYAVIHELAVSNLLLGLDVVVDAVNPVPAARSGWREASDRAGARLVHVETSLADGAEHRRRVEGRRADIPGHVAPSWDDVIGDGWVPWDEARDGVRVLVDTRNALDAFDAVRNLRDVKPPPLTSSGTGGSQ
ncbi:AAA family ATPase [uncultured Phycicoccus sp.]|uniref:AAA family ATPase n=1 Tax=uncultured Phycicoccus sp. TaxID=661422 RepID=UPI00260B02A4|nr:AAA family ATPase [uncultured Phycicoccus sp.]